MRWHNPRVKPPKEPDPPTRYRLGGIGRGRNASPAIQGLYEVDALGLREKERGVYERVAKAARLGEPCPKNDTLAEPFGYTPAWASRVLDTLVERGVLERVQRHVKFRQFRVVATGQLTAPYPPQERSHGGRR